jgi:hypothetical protein
VTRIGISLDPDIVAPDLPEGADRRLASHQYFLDKLGEAIESPKGIKLGYATEADAKGQRLKFYRARRYVARQGIKSFDRLTLIVEGSSLLIKKDLPPDVELL